MYTMCGKNIWKSSGLLVSFEEDLLEAKGKKVDVGTTKIYSAKDKKYAGKEVYHVYQKTSEPGKKAWKYVGTVGSKTGKADNHLKELGIDVEDGKPVGVDISKGKSMMIPPKEEEPTPAPEPAPAPVQAKPESPIKGADGEPISLDPDNPADVEFYSAILPKIPENEEDLHAAGMGGLTIELFKFVATATQQAASEGDASWPSVYAKLKEVTGMGDQGLGWTFGDAAKDTANAMAKAMVKKGVPKFAKAGYQIGHSKLSDLVKEPEKEVKIPEPAVGVTTAEQSVFNHKLKDLHDFIKAVDKATEGYGNTNDAFEKLKAEFPDVIEAGGGSVMGTYSMADELYIAHGNTGISHKLDAQGIYDNWLKGMHAGKSDAQMSDMYGPDWAKVGWGMAAAISKAKGGPGDTDTPVHKPKKVAPAVSPLTTASGFKVVASGKGKKVADGTTKIQPEKNGNLQVHVKKDGAWTYLGTVGAKKGAKKGAAEVHLKTLGIEADGKKLKGMDVPKAIAMVPSEEPKDDSLDKAMAAVGYPPAPKKPKSEVYAEKFAKPFEMLDKIDSDYGGNPGDVPYEVAKEWDEKYGDGTEGDWANTWRMAKRVKQGVANGLDSPLELSNFVYGSKGTSQIEDDFGKDWAHKVPAMVAAALALPKADYPVPSKKVKDSLKGFGDLYQIVKDAGGVPGLSDQAKKTFDQHQPGWKENVAIADLLSDHAKKTGVTTAMLDQAAKDEGWNKAATKMLGADWQEKAAEIHKQVYGAYPGDGGTFPPGTVIVKGMGGTPAPPAPLPDLKDLPDYDAMAAMPGGPDDPAKKPKKKKKKPVAGVVMPSIPDKPDFEAAPTSTKAADLPIPPPSGLTKKKDAGFLGGAGQKAIYTDANGNEFLFKLATKKGSGKADPMRAHVQAAFSEIAKQVKPIHPKIEVTKLGGVVGAIYPFLPGADKVDLAGESPSSLSPQEKLDVAEEHVIDWLTSQHDSHSKNFLRTDEGRIVGVDKEQGFKYFGDDKLDISYHPNSKYGENEPFYNAFWREFSQGKNDFDPKQLSGAVDRAMSIPTVAMENALRPYAEVRFPGDSIAQAGFIRQALNRKNTLKRDYEKFVTGLMEKKEGASGTFTFAAGWVKQGEEDKPYEQTINHPEKTESGDVMLAGLGGTSKSVPHKTDPTKLTIKTTESQASLKKILTDLGFPEEAKNIKTGGHYKMAFVDKAAWESAGKTTPAWTETKTIYPEPKGIGPTPAKPAYMPIVDAPKATTPNSEFFSEITKKTKMGLGVGVTLDGPMVEHQRARVIRKKDDEGEYYEVSFKLREVAHKNISGGSSETYVFSEGKHNKKTDTLSASGATIHSSPAKQWSSESGEINLLSTVDTSKFAYKGMVIAKVRSKDVDKGLKELLNKMKPGLAKDVVRDPTDEDREIAALSGALYAKRPKKSDELAKKEIAGTWERTPENLKAKLKGKIKKADLDKIGQIEVGPAHASAVIPGRWKNLAGGTPEDPHARFIFWELSDPKKLANMFKGGIGAAGINERNMQGIERFGSSYGQDVNTGCASGMTTRVATKNNDNSYAKGSYGSIRIIVAPDELDRTDAFLHKGDKYGCMNGDQYGDQGSSYRNRKDLDASLKSAKLGDELVVRQLMPAGKVLRVSVDSESLREQSIKAFRAQGIEEVNGVPVEDFVVVAGKKTIKQVYETYVKPAGY